MDIKCNPGQLNEYVKGMLLLPRKFMLAGLGFAGMLPELAQETLPRRVSELLADSENLFNHAAERGEIILEERQR